MSRIPHWLVQFNTHEDTATPLEHNGAPSFVGFCVCAVLRVPLIASTLWAGV